MYIYICNIWCGACNNSRLEFLPYYLESSDINVNADIAFDTETIIDSPTTIGLSVAHLNVNGLDVEGLIGKIRYLFQNKPYNIIGINETKLTDDAPTDKFEMAGYKLLRADRKKQSKTHGEVVLHYTSETVYYLMKNVNLFQMDLKEYVTM